MSVNGNLINWRWRRSKMAHLLDNQSSFAHDHGGEQGPQSVLGIIRDIDDRVRAGDVQDFQPVSTGFTDLDSTISGGFRLGQLALLSGPAGVGKTSLMLQIARNIVASNQAVCLFVCYEHETDYLAQRLISMESVGVGDGSPTDGLRLRDIADLV